MLSTVIVGINIPTTYSQHVPHIVARAKSVLAKRTNTQIEQAVQFVDAIIFDFIFQLKEKHKGNYRRHLETELQARHDFDILKIALKNCDLSSEIDLPNINEPELYAAFALAQIANALELMTCVVSGNTDQATKFSFQNEQFKAFLDLMICATEAADNAKSAMDSQKIILQNAALTAENQSLNNITDSKVQQEVKRVVSEKSRKAAIASHATDYAIQEQVNQWLQARCEENPRFLARSNSKIASEIFRLDLVSREYETLVKYVGAFKKSSNKAA